jgi:hypothetical protein
MSIDDKALAQITGFLITMLSIDVPIFILLVTAAIADRELIASIQPVLKTI